MNTASFPLLYIRLRFRSITSSPASMGAQPRSQIWLSPASTATVKGPNIAGLDSETGDLVRLFHPRTDKWTDHFVWDGPELKGRTQIGRVTISVLFINDPEVVALRRALQEEGVFGQ